MTENFPKLSRRRFLRHLGACVFVTSIGAWLPRPAWAGATGQSLGDLGLRRRYDLNIGDAPFILNGKTERVRATAVNGTVPGPLMHWRESDTDDTLVIAGVGGDDREPVPSGVPFLRIGRFVQRLLLRQTVQCLPLRWRYRHVSGESVGRTRDLLSML